MKKLSARLQHIFDWGTLKDYQSIYDICCDHGYLAYKFWKNTKAKVFAIDIAKPVVENLETNYLKITDERFHIECLAGEKVDYKDNSLIVIAGVGAHTTITILEKVLSDNLDEVDIIICCHQNTDILRAYLKESGLGLVNESLIKDKGKFYELIYLTTTEQKLKVQSIGSLMWKQENRDDLIHYLSDQLKYWEIKRDKEAYAILEAYKELNQQWES